MADDQQSRADEAKERFAKLRRRYPFLDHLLRMNAHYSKVEGSQFAGAVTYFGFLSFFPILALAFAVVGYVSVAYPDARDSLRTAIEQVFPGIVSSSGKSGTISLNDIENAKAAAGIIGFLGVLYSGLGWLSGLRNALEDAFQVPRARQPSFLIGKATDLVTLAAIGAVMIVSVGISGVVKGLADTILSAVSLDDVAIGTPLIWAVGHPAGPGGEHDPVLGHVQAAGQARPALSAAVAGGAVRCGRVRAAEAAGRERHRGSRGKRLRPAGHRDHAGRLDQLLLAARAVRRLLGA